MENDLDELKVPLLTDEDRKGKIEPATAAEINESGYQLDKCQ
jgi:hypothetical protein